MPKTFPVNEETRGRMRYEGVCPRPPSDLSLRPISPVKRGDFAETVLHAELESPLADVPASGGRTGSTKQNRGPDSEFSAHTRPPCELRIILQIARPSPPPDRSAPPPYDVYSSKMLARCSWAM